MSKNLILKRSNFLKRKKSIRKKLSGSSDKPRVSVRRSNNHIYAQIIDDVSGKTIATYSDTKLKKAKDEKKVDVAFKVGVELGKLAKAKKVKEVVFDRSGYKYHGRVKSLADGLRESDLKF